MASMSLGHFSKTAKRFLESLPPRLFENLNGGIIVEPRAKHEGEYLVMGEYLEDQGLGKLVILYYGSFRESLGNAHEQKWTEEIEETILHELRHHVESLAGVDDLSVEEMLELEEDEPEEKR